MEIKIIFLDLDGTLLNSGKEISREDRNALRLWSGKGVRIGYVTDRTDRKINKLIQDVPCDFICSLGGAHIRIFDRGRTIWEQSDGIDWNTGIEILKTCVFQFSYKVSAFFAPYSLWNGKVFLDGQKTKEFPDALQDMVPSRFQRIRLYDVGELPEWLKADCRISVHMEGRDVVLESTLAGKDYAVRRILEYYGFSGKEAVAFGDSDSDVRMFGCCDYSVAMGNASEKALETAVFRTDDCDHSGVAKWLGSRFSDTFPIHIKSSLGEENGIFLLRDLRGVVEPVSPEEKRRLLGRGVPGHTVLAAEPYISPKKMRLFQMLTESCRYDLAKYAGVLSESILTAKKEMPILVSLARGGIIWGAVCRGYYRKYYHVDVPHFVISLIRGYGLDEYALDCIVNHYGDQRIQFLDGWTGSGYMSMQLSACISEYNRKRGTKVSGELAVLADTSHICHISGTREDIMLPDCCLNATVCGLLSSICVTGHESEAREFHGAVIWDELSVQDFSRYYLDSILSVMEKQSPKLEKDLANYGSTTGRQIKEAFRLSDIGSVRLGIGESTRALFRRDVQFILAKEPENVRMRFLREMAEEKKIPIREYDTGEYMCITVLMENGNDRLHQKT